MQYRGIGIKISTEKPWFGIFVYKISENLGIKKIGGPYSIIGWMHR